MAKFKVSDARRTASLLKKLVERSDANLDGAVRSREARMGVTAKRKRSAKVLPPGVTVESMQKFSQVKGSSQIPDIKEAVDEVAKRVRAGDKDRDGFIDDVELRRLGTSAERNFVKFGIDYGKSTLEDFNFPEQREAQPPRFSWKGTPAQVCTSLLNAYSDRKNDNFWPQWSGHKGPSRYVLAESEAKKMVEALEPLYLSRQRAVLKELAGRTLRSEPGCVSVSAGARKVFERYAKELGLSGLEFKSPAAPKLST